MKKLIFFIVIVYMTFDSFSQCVNCDNTINTGTNSSAIGQDTKSLGICSFASGAFSEASGNASMALGMRNLASGIQSVAIGSFVQSTVSHAITLGSGYGEGSELINNNAYSLMVGFNSTSPTLFVSTPPQGGPHNKSGKIGIGNVTLPFAKLHIRADDSEAANIFIEPSNWTNDFNAEIWMGNQLHGISAELNKGLMFKTEYYYLFNQGNMGLGTEEPAAKVHVKSGDIYIEDIDRGIIMKSPDGTCWRGTVNNDGQIVFEALEVCPEDGTTSVSEPSPDNTNVKIYPNPAENQITIEISKLSSNSLSLEIIDELGRTVKTTNITDNETTISIEDLRPGIYYCRVRGEGIYGVEKIIKH